MQIEYGIASNMCSMYVLAESVSQLIRCPTCSKPAVARRVHFAKPSSCKSFKTECSALNSVHIIRECVLMLLVARAAITESSEFK